MIHFDFTVSDADAENIMEIMRNHINHNNMRIVEMMHDPEMYKQSIVAFRRDNEYVEGLIKKMTNTLLQKNGLN